MKISIKVGDIFTLSDTIDIHILEIKGDSVKFLYDPLDEEPEIFEDTIEHFISETKRWKKRK